MLEEVATKQRLWAERAQSADIGGIGQIGSDIDARQLPHIDMDNFDPAFAQRPKYLFVYPRLYGFASRGRAAAEIQYRRQPLRRERLERTAQPASLDFKHCDLERSLKKQNHAETHTESEELRASGFWGERVIKKHIDPRLCRIARRATVSDRVGRRVPASIGPLFC
jgi:hypothetical protein